MPDDDPQDDPPARRPLSSKRLHVFVTCYTLTVIVVCAGWTLHSSGQTRSNFLTGFLIGAALAASLLAFHLWQTRRPRP